MGFSKAHDAAARLSAIAAAAVLAAGAGACGSDDDGDGGDAAGTPASAAAGGAGSGGGPEGQLRAAYAKFTDSVYSTDYAAACAQMTARHRKEIVGDLDCASGLRTLFRGEPPRGERPKVVSLKIDGNRATLRTKSEDSFKPYPIEFVKQDGEWKVNKSVSGAAAGS
jgi:hypothetical protein